MKRLGTENYELLSAAVEKTGDQVEAFDIVKNDINIEYAFEKNIVFDFCRWIERTEKVMDHTNYEKRFGQYLEWVSKP